MDSFLAKQLRTHQRDGVQFLYDCVMGVSSRGYEGCILADEVHAKAEKESERRRLKASAVDSCMGLSWPALLLLLDGLGQDAAEHCATAHAVG